MKKILLLVLLGSMALATAWADKTVKADDPQVSYTGRVQKSGDGSVRYDWVGTYWQTDFTGGRIAINVSEKGESYHNVFIDGQLVRKIRITGSEPHRVVLADRLGKGTHRLMLQKCTEGEYGCVTLHSIEVADGARLQAVPARDRFIEVYGDSYTCGYGTEGMSAEEPFRLGTENCNLAYACIMARYFNADYSLVAHSGQGMVRDWGDTLQVSRQSMSTRYTHVFDDETPVDYDFATRRPDIVIINLGTNDYSPGNIPDVAQYVGAYTKMIATLTRHYGEVPILCITPHSANAYLRAAIGELGRAVAAMKHVHLAQPMPDIVVYGRDLGSDWHPNYQGQVKIAMTLIPQVAALTGWSLTPGKGL